MGGSGHDENVIPLNAFAPIVVTLLGIVRAPVKPQLEKQESGIVFTPAPILRVVVNPAK